MATVGVTLNQIEIDDTIRTKEFGDRTIREIYYPVRYLNNVHLYVDGLVRPIRFPKNWTFAKVIK